MAEEEGRDEEECGPAKEGKGDDDDDESFFSVLPIWRPP